MTRNCDLFLKLSEEGFLKLFVVVFKILVILEKGTAIVINASVVGILLI
jgi:hypothetical protein